MSTYMFRKAYKIGNECNSTSQYVPTCTRVHLEVLTSIVLDVSVCFSCFGVLFVYFLYKRKNVTYFPSLVLNYYY
jgi:hypothetical protein